MLDREEVATRNALILRNYRVAAAQVAVLREMDALHGTDRVRHALLVERYHSIGQRGWYRDASGVRVEVA